MSKCGNRIDVKCGLGFKHCLDIFLAFLYRKAALKFCLFFFYLAKDIHVCMRAPLHIRGLTEY